MIIPAEEFQVDNEKKSSLIATSISRRNVCKLGVAASIGLPLQLLAQSADRMRPQPGDQIVFDGGDQDGQLVSVHGLPVNAAPVAAFPRDPVAQTIRSGSRLNRVMIMRADNTLLSESTQRFAAEGVVAYSAVCTHTGCDVFNWKQAELRMACPCHESEFDVLNAGQVVGGPAPRPLAMLPLTVIDGELRVAAEFTSRVGFQQQF